MAVVVGFGVLGFGVAGFVVTGLTVAVALGVGEAVAFGVATGVCKEGSGMVGEGVADFNKDNCLEYASVKPAAARAAITKRTTTNAKPPRLTFSVLVISGGKSRFRSKSTHAL